MVLGRSGGLIQQIYLPSFLGVGGRMGSGTQPLPWIHVKDLAGLVRHAINEEKMEGVYNAVAPQVYKKNYYYNYVKLLAKIYCKHVYKSLSYD